MVCFETLVAWADENLAADDGITAGPRFRLDAGWEDLTCRTPNFISLVKPRFPHCEIVSHIPERFFASEDELSRC